MKRLIDIRSSRRFVRSATTASAAILCLATVLGSIERARAESKATELKIRSESRDTAAPAKLPPVPLPPANQLKLAAPIRPVQLPSRTPLAASQANFQIPAAGAPPTTMTQPAHAKDPCAGMNQAPMIELGINIAPTEGELPTNDAATCWEPFNQSAGPFAGARCWGPSHYNWDATCLCHRPLYFEEINLERYGYGCCETLQPAASAAHFFGTIPMLPYCMAVDCPCECVYTLGHYRPGSCPPWRHHWPPCTIPAISTEAAVLAGLILIFP